MMYFSKAKMMERLTAQGLADKVTPDIEAMMDNFDGQPVSANCWDRVVNDEPVLWCVGKDGTGDYVAECDCVR